eukprot:NODE_1070_length_1502_cov_0.099073.p1 type:complete len:284 gc:universal NODE_1070_length_1502_cov_0.099073:466-1317(+)
MQKETEKEILEEKYILDVKGIGQKIVLLQYEHSMNLVNEKVKMDSQITASTSSYTGMILELKKRVSELETELVEQQCSFQQVFGKELLNQEQEKIQIRRTYQKEIGLLNDTLVGKIKSFHFANNLELKSKLQIIEDKFHMQIQDLMGNNEKSLLDLKSYFNELTQNQIILIEGLKEQLNDSKKNEERYKRQVNFAMNENKSLKKPLEEYKLENEKLNKELLFSRRQLQSFKVDQAKSFQLNEENIRIADENANLKNNLHIIKDQWTNTKDEYNKKLRNLYNKN